MTCSLQIHEHANRLNMIAYRRILIFTLWNYVFQSREWRPLVTHNIYIYIYIYIYNYHSVIHYTELTCVTKHQVFWNNVFVCYFSRELFYHMHNFRFYDHNITNLLDKRQYLTSFQAHLATFDLTDGPPSSISSSIVCVANGYDTEIGCVVMSSLVHCNKNVRTPLRLQTNRLTAYADHEFTVIWLALNV